MTPSDEFWEGFVRVAKLSRELWDVSMRKIGGRTGQSQLLYTLWAQNGLTPKEIATRLRVTTPTVVKMAARMEAQGFLRRRRDARDRRLVRLYLTEQGRSVRKPIEEARRNLRRRVEAGLTEDERRYLASSLAKIIRNLEIAENHDKRSPRK